MSETTLFINKFEFGNKLCRIHSFKVVVKLLEATPVRCIAVREISGLSRHHGDSVNGPHETHLVTHRIEAFKVGALRKKNEILY